MRRTLRLYPRKRLDIGWWDLAAGIVRCAFPGDIKKNEAAVEHSFAPGEPMLIAYCVRAGFDLCLQALEFPKGSEIVMSALTIREMADIARKHGLVPIPLDLNLETLAPEISDFEHAINPRTRAIVIAHLFGSRVPMDPFIEVAERHGIFVFEDCAQAFTGTEYTGHPQTNAAMFSFGSIKTATAVGGAVLRLQDAELLHKMRTLQQSYPTQKRTEYLHELITHVCVKIFTVPLFFGLFYRACVFLNKDFEQVISAVRNLPVGEEELEVIRKQPSAPLVALLARRLRTFSSARLQERVQVGSEFARALPPGLTCLGSRAEFHSFWVFPALMEAPEQFAVALRAFGFDATTAGSALSVIEPPPGGKVPAPVKLQAAYRKLIYLPVYPEMPSKGRARLLEALREIQKARPHLQVTDARRIYSACVQDKESPRTISDFQDVLERARRSDAPICTMGTIHNLGGHAFADGAIGLDMTRYQRVVALDVQSKRITVESGITWAKIQETINPVGLAVKAMQSDNIFTVGGSMSSNAHGRDIHTSTLIESILGFRILLANGSVISVSRKENPELFRLVIGGYGLFGIILEVDLELTENCVYEQTSEVMPIPVLAEYFNREVRDDQDADLFLARPSIAPGCFLADTIVSVWRKTSSNRKDLFALDHERNVRRDRFLFGLSRKYSWGKTVRWHAEKLITKRPSRGRMVTRNNAMRPPVSAIKMLEYDSPTDTDAIQEFFVPIPSFLTFLEAARCVFREHQANLLGMTIRYLKRDIESFLSYAPRAEAFAVILYINEGLAIEARVKARALIQRLTRLALENEGTFYLTYARDVEPEDLRRAYPGIDAFFHEKHRFDPENRFTSRFFEMYREKFVARRAASGA